MHFVVFSGHKIFELCILLKSLWQLCRGDQWLLITSFPCCLYYVWPYLVSLGLIYSMWLLPAVPYRPNIFFINSTLLKWFILKSLMWNGISESCILNKNLKATLPRWLVACWFPLFPVAYILFLSHMVSFWKATLPRWLIDSWLPLFPVAYIMFGHAWVHWGWSIPCGYYLLSHISRTSFSKTVRCWSDSIWSHQCEIVSLNLVSCMTTWRQLCRGD